MQVFVCEECGYTANDFDPYINHVRLQHPLSASLLKINLHKWYNNCQFWKQVKKILVRIDYSNHKYRIEGLIPIPSVMNGSYCICHGIWSIRVLYMYASIFWPVNNPTIQQNKLGVCTYALVISKRYSYLQ